MGVEASGCGRHALGCARRYFSGVLDQSGAKYSGRSGGDGGGV